MSRVGTADATAGGEASPADNANSHDTSSDMDGESTSDSDVPFDYPIPNKLGYTNGKNNAWLTAGIIVADVVGAGILGMPRAVAQFGWLMGGFVLVAMLAANVHISILMWKVRMQCKSASDARTYVALCRAAFAQAPKWQRRLLMTMTGVSQYSFMFGLMGIYLLSSGKGLGMVFNHLEICLTTWSIIAAVVILPFAGTAREMGSYQSLVWINIITLCGTVLIPLGYYVVEGTAVLDAQNSKWYAVAPVTVSGALSGLSTFTFGMTSQFMLTEIIGEMKDPSELPKAYAGISAPFQLAAFALAGLGGYYFLGSNSEGMLNENLPFNAAFQVAAGCLVIHMLISYLIKGVVFSNAILKSIAEEYSNPDDPRKRSLAAHNAVVIPTLAATWLLANLVPFFGDAVDLLGASFTPLSCWVVPLLMFFRHYYDCQPEDRPKVGFLEWVLIAGEMALALTLMFLGTYSSMVNIVEHWHEYGPPFACHCEHIWSTCDCSRDHIGMSYCRV